jgi:predicted nuclease of predicted toxin-antitoxin system
MRFLLDENVEWRVADFLRDLGHDVAIVGVDLPASTTDRQVLAYAVAHDRILLTNDSDFGSLVFEHQFEHRGVIFFRIGDVPAGEKIRRLAELFERDDSLHEQFTVLTPTSIRVRQRGSSESGIHD